MPDPPGIEYVDRLQTRLVELVVALRETMPVKPFTGETVIDELPGAPAFTDTTVGLADIVKSGDPCVTTETRTFVL